MKRHSIWTATFILIFSLFCLTSLCSAITVEITEVSPGWIPEASESDDLSIAWVWVTISGITERDQYKQIEISLTTSMLSGICGNSTNQDIVDTGLQNLYNSTIKDLIFRSDENDTYWEVVSLHKLRYTVPSDDDERKATVTFPVGVLSLDFGAHGRLHGGVKKRSGDDDTSAVLPTLVRIPRDKNYNNIADSWNNDYYALDAQGNLDAGQFRRFGIDADVDTSMDSVHSGDRLTAFEEYRGFMTWPYAPARGRIGSDPPSVQHTRTSPDTKDMFIVNENSETKYRGTGTGHTRLSQHLLPSTHVNVNGQVDFRENRGDAAYSVKVVTNSKITNDPPYGVAKIGPPRAGAEATIYTSYIKLQEGSGADQVIGDVIGHEIGHWAHLEHCPELTDVNGNSWEDQCRMYWEYDRDQNEYASHHDRDYSLKGNTPVYQESAEPDPQNEQGNPQRGTLSSVSGSYTATAGGSHTANFSTSSAYSSVYWYVKSPTDTTAYGTNVEIDQGDGSTTTASLSYTFSSSAVAGNWTILAYVYPGSGSIYELSYMVYVSRPVVVFSPSFSVGSSSYSAGNTLYGTVTSSSSDPIYGSHLFVKAPGDTSAYGTNMGWFPGSSTKTTTSVSLSYTFPSDATTGSYQITARVYPWNGDTWGTPVYLSENVTVTAATSTTTTTTQGFSPSFSVGSSSYSAGGVLTATVTSTSSDPIYGSRLYVKAPGDTSTYGTNIGWFGGSTAKTTTSLSLSYTFPSDATTGSYQITARVYPWDGDTWGTLIYLSESVNVY